MRTNYLLWVIAKLLIIIAHTLSSQSQFPVSTERKIDIMEEKLEGLDDRTFEDET